LSYVGTARTDGPGRSKVYGRLFVGVKETALAECLGFHGGK